MEEYRNTGFKTANLTARELAEELEVEPMFRTIKIIQIVKREADETGRIFQLALERYINFS